MSIDCLMISLRIAIEKALTGNKARDYLPYATFVGNSGVDKEFISRVGAKYSSINSEF